MPAKENAQKTVTQFCNGEVQRAGHATLEGRPGCYTVNFKGCLDPDTQSHSFSTLKPARAKFTELAALN